MDNRHFVVKVGLEGSQALSILAGPVGAREAALVHAKFLCLTYKRGIPEELLLAGACPTDAIILDGGILDQILERLQAAEMLKGDVS